MMDFWHLLFLDERAGILVAVTGSPDEAAAVKSQLKRITRALVSNPPNHGARIVATVLNNPALYQEWYLFIYI